MKDLTILNMKLIFFILASLEESWQSVSSCICLALVIIDLKMVLREFLGAMDFLGAQTFCIHETTEIIVVCKDKNFMFAAFQVVVPSLECFNNG